MKIYLCLLYTSSFEKQIANYPEIEMDYLKTDLAPKTAPLAKGYDAVCALSLIHI